MTSDDFPLLDTAGSPAKWCEIHGALMGSECHTHDECGTTEITFAVFWALMTEASS